MATLDQYGIQRHAMTKAQLQSLYKQLEDFIADLTPGEYAENEPSFIRVKTAIHQRMRKADN